MAILNESLAWLLDPFEQYDNLNGKPLVGGWLEVFLAGTDTKYISYQNFDGTQNPFRIPIPADGRVRILVSPANHYDVYVYSANGNLVTSRLNIVPAVGGTVSLHGKALTTIKNDDQTLDVSLTTQAQTVNEYTINSNNKPLGVQEPLIFVQDDEEATIIGLDEEAIPAVVEPIIQSAISSISGEFVSSGDLSAYQEKSGMSAFYPASNPSGFINELPDSLMDESKLDFTDDKITGYNGSAFLNGDQEVNDLVHSASGTWNDVTGKMDVSKLEFDEFGNVSGYDGSSFAGWEANQLVYSSSGYWNSVSSKTDNSAFTAYTAAHSGDDVTPYSGGNGIQIQNHIVSITGQLGKVYSGENHVVVNNTTDKIGLDATAVSAIESLQGVYDLSAGQGVSFRKEDNVVYVDAIGADIDYTPIIEDI